MSVNIDFVLSEFNNSLTLTEQGLLVGKEIELPAHDAIAVLNVSTADMRAVFKYQTDSLDVTDVNAEDLKYYTFLENWPANLRLNPVNAMMDHASSENAIASSGIDTEKMLLKHDFERYLALKLFGTYRGVDLFTNEKSLIENMSFLGGDVADQGVFKNIFASLKKVCTNGELADLSITGEDTSGNRYTTNDIKTQDNIVRELMQQIFHAEPNRFSDISLPDEEDGTYRPVPLMDDDKIYFTLTMNAAAGQETLTNVPEIDSRTYLIKLILGSDTTNTAVSDSVFVADSAYSEFSLSKVASTDISGTVEGSLPETLSYMGGWYNAGASAASWAVPVVGVSFEEIEAVYASIHLLSNAVLPTITINTSSGSITYTPTSTDIVVNDNYDCQFYINITSNDVGELDGYNKVSMTTTGNTPPSGPITSITIESAEGADFVATTIGVVSGANKQVIYLV
jgi:hypothetical protein